MKDKEIIRQVDLILKRVSEIDSERKEWEQKLLDIFPVKIGEKVSVNDKNGFVRYAFVSQINMYARGKEKKMKIEFELNKCTNGTRSNQSYYLKHINGEYITKIKK